MRSVLPSLLLLAGLLPAADPTPAVDPVRQAKAQAVVESCQLRQQLEKTTGALFAQQAGSFGGDMPEPMQKAFRAALDEIAALLAKDVDYQAMTAAAVAVYADRFTAEELDQLAAFNATALGQKLAAAGPELTSRLSAASTAQIKTLMPRIQAIMGKHLSAAQPEPASVTPPGSAFPGFTGTTVDGKPFDFASLKGKVVLVDFWATWCGPCRAEMPNVKAAYAKHQAAGFEVVGISLDEDAEALKAYLAKEQVPWVQLFDGKGWENAIAQQFQIRSIPATFLIGKDGTVVATDLRGDALDEAVAKALSAP